MSNRIIAVDFDGTLFENKFPDIGEPIWPVIDAAKRARRAGDKLILWTMREGDSLSDALEECDKAGLHFDAVNDNLPQMKTAYGNNPRKIFANEYWDDHAINPDHVKEQLIDPSCGISVRMGDVAFIVRWRCGAPVVRLGCVTEIYYDDDMRLCVSVKGAGRGVWMDHVFPTEDQAVKKMESMRKGKRNGL